MSVNRDYHNAERLRIAHQHVMNVFVEWINDNWSEVGRPGESTPIVSLYLKPGQIFVFGSN